MKKLKSSIHETFYTFSFMPFMLVLFLEDIIELVELKKNKAYKVIIQIGINSLDYNLNTVSGLAEIVKSDKMKQLEYHSFYIHIQSITGKKDEPYLIMDIAPTSYSFYQSDAFDPKLTEIGKKIKEIITKRNIYRIFRNRLIDTIIFICDLFFVFYILFLKDMLQKYFDLKLPDFLLLMLALLLNLIFIVPHGKNKIYLFDKNEVNFFKKNREVLFLSSLMGIIGLITLSIIINLFIK
jgi:hypothetical protein